MKNTVEIIILKHVRLLVSVVSFIGIFSRILKNKRKLLAEIESIQLAM